jgi:hypothetical protein
VAMHVTRLETPVTSEFAKPFSTNHNCAQREMKQREASSELTHSLICLPLSSTQGSAHLDHHSL